MITPAAVVTIGAFATVVLAVGVIVAVESRYRPTDWPTLDEWWAAAAVGWRHIRRELDEDRPRSRGDIVRDLAWFIFGPALCVRFLIHIGGAVAIRGGDPGSFDGRRIFASPAVEVRPFEDLRLRLATLCYGLFWLQMGTRAMDPAGRVFFGAQLAVLLIDPCLWAGAWVLSSIDTDNMTLKDNTQTQTEEQHGVR